MGIRSRLFEGMQRGGLIFALASLALARDGKLALAHGRGGPGAKRHDVGSAASRAMWKRAEVLSGRGWAAFHADDEFAAEAAYNRALGLLRRAPNRLMEAQIQTRLGDVLTDNSRRSLAIVAYQKAADTFGKLRRPAEEANALERLGSLEFDSKHEQGLCHMRQAIALRRQCPDQLALARSLVAYVNVATGSGLVTVRECLNGYQEALPLLEKAGVWPEIGMTLKDAADEAEILSDYKLAANYNRRAIAVYQRLKDPDEVNAIQARLSNDLR